MEIFGQRRAIRGAVLFGAFAVLVGCAHVNEETLATEMDRLRAEMQSQDQGVEDRLANRMDEMETDIDARLTSLQSELSALQSQFDVTVERLESAIRFNTPIHFAFDDDIVGAEDQRLLDHFAQVVNNYYQYAIVTVEGFTDPSGGAEYNLALGERRAEAVRDYLESAGLPGDRMRVVSYGEDPERQITEEAQGPGDSGWQNRRVSMVIDFNEPLRVRRSR